MKPTMTYALAMAIGQDARERADAEGRSDGVDPSRLQRERGRLLSVFRHHGRAVSPGHAGRQARRSGPRVCAASTEAGISNGARARRRWALRTACSTCCATPPETDRRAP